MKAYHTTSADSPAERVIYPTGIVFLATWFIGTSIVGFIGALSIYGFWLVMESMRTMFGHLGAHNFRGAMVNLDSGVDDQMDDALAIFNNSVSGSNAITIFSLWAVTARDLIVGLWCIFFTKH